MKCRSAEELETAATELKNSLRSIEWDLEDLEDTVKIVEKNPTKFRINGAELAIRKGKDSLFKKNPQNYHRFIFKLH